MTKSIILHVGAPRTGSTALQFLATKYNQELRAQGILYPVTAQEVGQIGAVRESDVVSGNAHEFYKQIYQDRAAVDRQTVVEVLVERFAERINGSGQHDCSVIFLSSENLACCNEDDFGVVREVLTRTWPGESVRILPLLVVRDLLDHAVSWWGHITRRHAYKSSREDFVLEHYQFEAPDVAARLATVFGAENLLVLKHTNPLDIVTIAAANAGLKPPPDFGANFLTPGVNSAMSLQALNVLQQCNSLVPPDSWITNYEGDALANEFFFDLGDFLQSADGKAEHDLLQFAPEVVGDIHATMSSKFGAALAEFNRQYRPIGGDLAICSRGPEASNLAPETTLRDSEGNYSFSMLSALARNLVASSDRYQALRARAATAAIVRDSGIFDQRYYMRQIESLKKITNIGQNLSDDLALCHYLQVGWLHGLKPCAFFNPLWYEKKYPDLQGINPTEHYILYGSREGRTPCANVPEGFAAKYRNAGNVASLLLGLKAAEMRQEMTTAA